MKKVVDLKAEREKLVAELHELDAQMGDNATDEQKGKFDAQLAAIDAKDAEINRAAKMEAFAPTNTPKPAVDPANAILNPLLGMSGQELANYSILNAVRRFTDGSWHRENSLEREASEAMAKVLGKSARGFFIPSDVLAAPMRAAQRKSSDGAGGYLIAEELRTQSFIDMLSNRLALYNGGAGCTVLTGLVGDIAIPRQSGGTTVYWVAEGTGTNGTVTASDLAFEQVAMTPKCVGAATEIGRKMMLQTSMDVEGLVRSDLARSLSLGIDAAAINGNAAGTSNQPTGVMNTASINTRDTSGAPTVPDWADIVALETLVSAANADVGRLAYLTTPGMRGYLKSTQKFATTNGATLWDDGPNPLNGYAAMVSNQVPANITQNGTAGGHALLFGNWEDLIIGFWSGLDLLVNPYAHDLAGAVRVVVFQDVDIAVRHPQSFALKVCAAS